MASLLESTMKNMGALKDLEAISSILNELTADLNVNLLKIHDLITSFFCVVVFLLHGFERHSRVTTRPC